MRRSAVPTGDDCLRARECASLRLDEQLSELESARLEAHLVRCDDCRALVGGMTAAADALRAAPLEPAPFRFELPRRGVAPYALRAASIAAVAAVTLIALVSSFQLQAGGDRSAAPARVDRALLGLKDQQLDALSVSSWTISPGLAAAERMTLDPPARQAAPVRRNPPK